MNFSELWQEMKVVATTCNVHYQKSTSNTKRNSTFFVSITRTHSESSTFVLFCLMYTDRAAYVVNHACRTFLSLLFLFFFSTCYHHTFTQILCLYGRSRLFVILGSGRRIKQIQTAQISRPLIIKLFSQQFIRFGKRLAFQIKSEHSNVMSGFHNTT